jgi:hypothetical protein
LGYHVGGPLVGVVRVVDVVVEEVAEQFGELADFAAQVEELEVAQDLSGCRGTWRRLASTLRECSARCESSCRGAVCRGAF